ncbi:MAG: bifunctional demethylmenaquinone methyltransferase/2-methoxy-6-polyprenyl-1,4-benzoquinol methylase UbiE [Wolinella sp.]
MSKESKQDTIIKMFDEIAGSYDLANRVLSFGIDVSWRKKACQLSFSHLKRDGVRILDVACGTGDMILHWEKNAREQGISIEKVVGIDPSEGMLKVAREKLPNVEFILSEAKELPLESESVDIVSIAYGIRNVVERERAIGEFYRILKPGGILAILEFTKCENPTFLERLAGFYTKNILPYIGGIISKNYAAYRYLPDSIEEFLTREKLNGELSATGFEVVYSRSYSANISTLFIAKK